MALRILFHESHNVGFYGAAQSLYYLILGLAQDKFEPWIACSQEGPLLEKCRDQGIPTLITGHSGHFVQSPNRFSRLANTVLEIRWVFRWLKQNSYDVVHCNRLRSVILAGLPARLLGLPVIWHYRRGRKIGWAELLGGMISTHIIAVSTSLKAQFEISSLAKYLKIASKVSVVYNGVPIEQFSPKSKSGRLLREFDLQKDHKVIGIIAALIPRKGIELFIQMAETLTGEYPEIRFLVVGGVPDNQSGSYFRELAMVGDNLIKSRRLIFTGWRDDVADILSLLDVLVLSSYSEGLARVVIEAMASGIPVVATDTEGAREAIIAGETGYVVPIGNVKELVAFTKRILDSPELAERMGAAARQRVISLFSIDSMVRSVEAIYEVTYDKRTPWGIHLRPDRRNSSTSID